MRSGRPTRSNLRRCKTWIGRTMYRRTDQQSRMGMFRCPGAGSSRYSMWAFASDRRRLRRTMLRLGIVKHLKNHEGGKLCNRLMTPLFLCCKPPPPVHLCNHHIPLSQLRTGKYMGWGNVFLPCTIHHALGLATFDGDSETLQCESGKAKPYRLRKLFEGLNCKVFIVDEVSMVGCRMLRHIHSRLCEIMQCEDKPFGVMCN